MINFNFAKYCHVMTVAIGHALWVPSASGRTIRYTWYDVSISSSIVWSFCRRNTLSITLERLNIPPSAMKNKFFLLYKWIILYLWVQKDAYTQLQILIFNAFPDMISCFCLVLFLPLLPWMFCWLLSKMVIVCCCCCFFFLRMHGNATYVVVNQGGGLVRKTNIFFPALIILICWLRITSF